MSQSHSVTETSLIELWCGRVSSHEVGVLETHCENCLPPEEREQAKRFRQLTTRNQHIVGRGMARVLLAGGRVSPQAIRFCFNEFGKPDVAEPLMVRRPFNIAHTDGLVLCAAAQQGRIGVDVERLSRGTDCGVAKRYFAAPEVDYVWSHEDAEARKRAFLRVWTLKESFVKAVGRGLAIPLADFAFEDIDSDAPRIRMLSQQLENAGEWSFRCFSPADGYVAALAVSSGVEQPVQMDLRHFDPLNLPTASWV